MRVRRFLALLLAWVFLLPCLVRAAEPPYVALTFDDGPSGRFTRRLLAGLAEREIPATFFLCGYRLETYGDLAREMAEAGHELGLHGYSHDSMAAMSPETLRRELSRTAERLRTCAGVEATLLRPPGGKVTQDVRRAAGEMGLCVIQWSVDPKDWATHDREAVVRRVVDQTRAGDVILLHDMSDSSVDAALEIADRLTGAGYRFVTVSHLASLTGSRLTPGAEYSCFSAPCGPAPAIAFSRKLWYSMVRN